MAVRPGLCSLRNRIQPAAVGRLSPGWWSVLPVSEQGLGDTLHFIRYAPLVKQRGGTVVLACLKALHPLLANGPGIDRFVPLRTLPPDFDVHAPLLSLPSPASARPWPPSPRGCPTSSPTPQLSRAVAARTRHLSGVQDRDRLARQSQNPGDQPEHRSAGPVGTVGTRAKEIRPLQVCRKGWAVNKLTVGRLLGHDRSREPPG